MNPQLALTVHARGVRAKLTPQVQEHIQRNGWQLKLVQRDTFSDQAGGTFEVNVDALPAETRVDDILRAAPANSQPTFAIAKMLAAQAIGGDFPVSQAFTPCFIYKLNSSYPQTLISDGGGNNNPDIDVKHWARRYVTLAKSRYLLFFRSEHHSQWA